MKSSYRPKFHFSPPQGWMNDPNGLVYHDGIWHLFYQFHPHSLEFGPMNWGHATSHDLVAWQHSPIALSPDILGNIWSGSAAVTPQNEIVACFTHQSEARQVQSLAFSRDGGLTFEKYPENPVLCSERRDFRDPKIFRYGDEWRLIIAAGGEAQIFTSSDLKTWQWLADFPAPHEGWVWECPDLFPLDGKWVLLASFVVPDSPHETHYWVGDFDGTSFTPQGAPQKLSFGPDDYAAVAWSNAPEGRRIIIGWMNRWSYAAQIPTQNDGFRGVMTLPRELSLRDGKLLQNPVRELEAYRKMQGDIIELDGQAGSCWLSPREGRCLEIEAEIEVGDAEQVGFSLTLEEDELFWVGYTGGQLILDRTQAGHCDIHPSFAGKFSVPCPLTDGRLKLRIFVDSCSVEVFAQDGEFYGAALNFPSPAAQDIEWTVLKGSAKIRHGAIYELFPSIHAD